MSKPYKIKRNSKVYRGRSRRASPMTVILSVLICAALAFVGWSLYQPVYDLLTGRISSSTQEESSSSSQPPALSASESEPETPPVEEDGSKKLIYLPNAILSDAAKLDAFLQTAVDQGATGVMMDLKDADGRLRYRSTLSQAVEAGAIAGDAVDLTAVMTKLREKGLTASARLYAWEDHLAPRTFMDMAIKYNGNNDYLWLDNSLEKGGQPWLNPYSAEAQKYITDLSLELAGLGVKEIILDGFYFPTMAGSELASFGPNVGSLAKDACLKNYVAALTEALKAQKAELTLCITSAPLFSSDNPGYGGVSPVSLGFQNLLVNAMPASFASKMELGGQTVAAPVQNPYQAVTVAASEVKKLLPEGVQLSMFVQCYTNTQLAGDVNKTYTRADISEQVKALAEQGVEDYLLFSPTGEFPAA